MRELYTPPSEFLQSMADGEIPLSGNEFTQANLGHLIGLMQHEEPAMRDWATFLLAQDTIDSKEVRAALLRASQDERTVVRAEAALGLAKRDRLLALPLVQEALRADTVVVPMLEAAALCAHPSLVADLRIWAAPSDNSLADELAVEALSASERSDHWA